VKADQRSLRLVFARHNVALVRVTATGFLVDHDHHDQLQGRVTRQQLLRKRFDDGQLVCDSANGIRARNGTLCETCLHHQCRPWLRIHLTGAEHTYIVDLAVTSAQSLLALEDDLTNDGQPLSQSILRLTVRDRGRWGEVCFEPIAPPLHRQHHER
jgi:hypothetical protein